MLLSMTYHQTSQRMLSVLIGIAFLGALLAPGFQTPVKAEMTNKSKGKLIGGIGGAVLGVAVLAMLGPITLVGGAIYALVGGVAGWLLGGGFGAFLDWFENETSNRDKQIDRILRDDTPDM